MAKVEQVKEIKVEFVAKGQPELRKLVNEMSGVNKSVKSINKNMLSFRGLLASIAGFSFAGIGIGELVRIADTITLTESRIESLFGDVEDTTMIMQDLVDIASISRQAFTDTAQAFTRFSIALDSAGVSADVVKGITQAFGQSALVAGSNVSEVNGVLIQLSQAFSRGQLRGQELISVMSNAPLVFAALKAEVEVTGQSIAKFAEEGKLTSEFVIRTLGKNFQKIDKQARELQFTFGQTLTVALNDFSVAVGDFNKAFKLNELFRDFFKFLQNNLPLISTVAIPAFAGLAVATGSATAGVLGLSTAFRALWGSINLPVTLAVTAFTLLIATLVNFGDEIFKIVLIVEQAVVVAFTEWLNIIPRLINGLLKLLNLDKTDFGKGVQAAVDGISKPSEEAQAKIKKLVSEIQFFGKSSKKAGEDYSDLLSNVEIKSPVQNIEILNREFARGELNVIDYAQAVNDLKLNKLQNDLENGAKSIFEFNEEIRELKRQDLTDTFTFGIIGIEEFNSKIAKLDIEKLNEKFARGKMSLGEYAMGLAKLNKELPGLGPATLGAKAGIASFNDSFDSFAFSVAEFTVSTFQNFENTLVDGLATGKLSFNDFTQSILSDLAKLAVRFSIVIPLAKSLASLVGVESFSSGATGTGGFKSPGVPGTLEGPLQPANLSSFKTTNTGTSAFSGAPGGSNVIVNINNNSDAEVSATESTGPNGERVLDLAISRVVKNGISNGTFDKSFNQTYGLRRKGV